MMRLLVLSAFLVFASAATIPELATQLGCTELVKLVEHAGLAEVLSREGPFTVFAPTNDAFAKLPKAVLEDLMRNRQLLSEVLKYHLVYGSLYSSELTNEMTEASLAPLANIRFNIYNTGNLITAEGSPVEKANQNASNGVIHVVNRVLFPIPFLDIPQLIVRERARFSILLDAVVKANIVAVLSGGPFTLFAPTNDAFAKIPADALKTLFDNITALTDVLNYHVISGTFWSSSLSDGMTPKTVEGKTVKITINGGGKVSVNNANVEEADDAVTNGVIHVIDTVLLPPSFHIN